MMETEINLLRIIKRQLEVRLVDPQVVRNAITATALEISVTSPDQRATFNEIIDQVLG